MTSTTNHDRSRALMERGRALLPGGVDSPVRAYNSVGGDPVVLARTCVFGVPDIACTMVDETDATGTIEVPINSEIQLLTTALRYFPELTTYTTTEEPRDVDIDLGKESNVIPLLVAAGVTADPEKGQLAWLAQTGPGMGLEGVTATLVGTGEGPVW